MEEEESPATVEPDCDLGVGELIVTRPIPNHGGQAYRVHNLNPRRGGTETWLRYRMVDKLWHGEVAVVLEVDRVHGYVRICTPRGVEGWIRSIHVRRPQDGSGLTRFFPPPFPIRHL